MYGRRIAHKIFLGYLLPLAVLFFFGVIGPFWLQMEAQVRVQNRERAEKLVTQVEDMRESAMDVRDHAAAYVAHGTTFEDDNRKQLTVSNQTYLRHLDNARSEVREGTPLFNGLMEADTLYQDWYRQEAHSPIRVLRLSNDIKTSFNGVDNALQGLIRRATDERERLAEDARVIERLRGVTTWPVLVIALVIALLIGRSITLGITRPLEALTRATEELEQGGTILRLSLRNKDFAQDEIGDLERSFTRMAQQVEQRTALLRAQNEALGSLNRRVAALMDATNDGIIMLDRAGGFSVVSRRFEHFFGIERDVLLDQTYSQAGALLLSRFRNRDEVRARFQEIVDDPEAIADETFDIIEPLPRTLRIYSAPVRGTDDDNGTLTNVAPGERELLGRIFVFRDATRETIVDRMKTEFVSTVSHELRTPLTAIKGYIDIILGGQTGDINELQREFLTMVQSSTHRLTALINDMLDISRIESGRMIVQHESTDYLSVIRDAIQMMTPTAQEKDIHLNVTVQDDKPVPLLNADANAVTQVLMNLISNGIKYTHTGGSVTVRVEPEETFVTTCIEDTGIGISDTDMPRLFQKFFRADNSTTREAGGTGLGLAITKAILEKLNGSIWVDSKPGKGTRFYFTLPAAYAVSTQQSEDAAESFAGTTQPIILASGDSLPASLNGESHGLLLLIGDDLNVLQEVSTPLRRSGYVTSIASTPEDALRRVQSLHPDGIALDLMSQNFDAFELLHEILSVTETASTMPKPPIMLIALSRRGFVDYKAASGQGVRFTDSFTLLQKPVAQELLCDWLSRASGEPESLCTVLTIGDPRLEARIRSCKIKSTARVLYAATVSEAEQLSREALPDLLILDMEKAGKGAARRLSRFLHHDLFNVTVPFLLLTEESVDIKRVRSFPTAGSGHRSPEAFPAFAQAIVQQEAGNQPVPSPLQGEG